MRHSTEGQPATRGQRGELPLRYHLCPMASGLARIDKDSRNCRLHVRHAVLQAINFSQKGSRMSRESIVVRTARGMRVDVANVSLVAICWFSQIALSDDEEKQPSLQTAAATQRLDQMRSLIDAIHVSSPVIKSESILKFTHRPLLRYNDPTRAIPGTQQLLDATVWRLSEKGRPAALVTLEIYPKGEGKAQLFYEFLSLSPLPLSMQVPTGVTWNAAATELRIDRFADAPPPADSSAARLVQMRRLARRVSVQEEDLDGEKVQCRLLAQPIDRYSDPETAIEDGAIFVFANGTNPEMGLLIECSNDAWSYGAFRLSAAAVTGKLDDKEVFAVRKMDWPYSLSIPYTSTSRTIDLPSD